MAEKKQAGYGMAGIYREIAEIAGEEIARTIHANFKGQQVVFPNKLYSSQYIAEKIHEIWLYRALVEKNHKRC